MKVPSIALIAFLALPAFGADLPVHIRNFGKVDGHVYRGGAPTEEGLKELAGIHVVLDIDLRQPSQGTEWEKNIAEKLGMTYLSVPMPELSAPSPESVKKVLVELTAKNTSPVFVHCRRGKDRTGTVIACYRIEQNHWTNIQAIEEANEYGMSYVERSMRHFILHFKPIELDASLVTK